MKLRTSSIGKQAGSVDVGALQQDGLGGGVPNDATEGE